MILFNGSLKHNMPLVVLNANSSVISGTTIIALTAFLPKVVSEALHVPTNHKAWLGPNDIEVRIQLSHILDANSLPLAIDITANDYPERKENLDKRVAQITEKIRDTFPDLRGRAYVWIILVPGSFELI